MKTLEELRAYFAADGFAMGQGIQIQQANETGAVCALTLRQDQKNAQGFAQGGLLYTLADFTFAVAANAVAFGTVTLNSDIHYIKGVAGGEITATARAKSRGRTICVYEVEVRDDAGALVATASFTGFTRQK